MVSRLKRSVASFFIRRSRMDSKKPDGAQAGQSPSEQQAFFLVPMQESDCSLARSAPVLPAWSGSRGTWTACLLSPGKQALPARCSLPTTLSAVTASTSSSSSLEDDALCWPASFHLPRTGAPCPGNVCWRLGISVLRTRPVFPTDVPRSQHKVANHVAVCYSTDVFYQANKYC